MKDRIIHNFFLVLLALLPISILIGPGVSLANIIIFDLFFVIFLIHKKDYLWIGQNIVKILFFFYLYLIINTFISLNYELSIYRNFGFLRLIILFIGINYFFNKNNDLNKILKVWTIVILIVVIDIFIEKISGTNILGYSTPNPSGSQSVERIVSFFEDEAIPGSYIYAFSFILIGFLLLKMDKSKIKSHIVFLVLSVILIVSVIVTGERSNSFRFLISYFLFLMLFYDISILKKFLIFSTIISTIFILLAQDEYLKSRAFKTTFVLADSYVETFQNPDPFHHGGNQYAELSRSGFEVFMKYPYFGVGNKNYRFETCNNNANIYYYCETHPHQVYFEFLSEHGLIGTFILFILFFLIFFNSIKKIFLEKNYIALGCFLYLLVDFIPLLPSGSFFSDYNLTLFFINLSIMYASSKKLNIFNYDK